MNNYRKGLYIAALSAVLAGAVAPSFAAGNEVAAQSEATQVERVSNAPTSRATQASEGRGTSSYSLHSVLLRAPAAPASAAQR